MSSPTVPPPPGTPPLDRGQRLELTLTEHAYGGESLGRDPSGRPVFVPYVLPGERVVVEVTEAHPTWARGRPLDLLQSSPGRLAPRCRHFTHCGGCHYQHMTYEAQLRAKTAILSTQLARLAGLADPPVRPIVAAPDPWNYRNHVQFGVDPAGRVTLQAAGAGRSFRVEECHLPEPAIAGLWPRLDLPSGLPVERVSLRAGSGGDALIAFHGAGPPAIELESSTEASVVWLGEDELVVLAGDGSIEISVHSRTFSVSAGSFFQVHTALLAPLVDLVLEALAVRPGEVVYDLYAGVGLFSAFLADAGATVLAVEESPSACADFERNLADLEASLFASTVEQALPILPSRPDAALVDPPRAGLSQEALVALVDRAPHRLVYVSCDPSTLARDARRLGLAGYALDHITPIDLFPQTFHIESVSRWVLQGRRTIEDLSP
jgi:23S rRNA (uracil1939-C5)-methyltransferase